MSAGCKEDWGSESGQMLPLAMLVVLAAGLFLVPFLAFAASSLRSEQITASAVRQRYSADAGVEAGIARLKSDRSLLASINSGLTTTLPALPIAPNTAAVSAVTTTARLLTTTDWATVRRPPGAGDAFDSMARAIGEWLEPRRAEASVNSALVIASTSASATRVSVSGLVTYQVVISNTSLTSQVTVSQVVASLPTGFALDPTTTTGGLSGLPSVSAYGELTWSNANGLPATLAPGGGLSFGFRAAAGTQWGSYGLPVRVSGTGFSTTSAEVSFVTVGPLAVSMAPSSGTASAGALVTYTLAVQNTGAMSLTLNSLGFLLPAGMSYVTGTTTGDVSCNPQSTGGQMVWTAAAPGCAGHFPASVAASTTLYITYVLRANAAGALAQPITISAGPVGGATYVITTVPLASVLVDLQPPNLSLLLDSSGPPGWYAWAVGSGAATSTRYFYIWQEGMGPFATTGNVPDGQVVGSGIASSGYPAVGPSGVQIPITANWGVGTLFLAHQNPDTSWVVDGSQSFNVRGKYEVVGLTSNGYLLTTRVAFAGSGADFLGSSASPQIVVYSWRP